MNFTVEWQPEAEDQLADLWASASDRAAVTDAARRIDRMLGHDPLSMGESRDGPVRVLFVSPLGVLYRIDEPAQMVRVASVGWPGRPV